LFDTLFYFLAVAGILLALKSKNRYTTLVEEFIDLSRLWIYFWDYFFYYSFESFWTPEFYLLSTFLLLEQVMPLYFSFEKIYGTFFLFESCIF